MTASVNCGVGGRGDGNAISSLSDTVAVVEQASCSAVVEEDSAGEGSGAVVSGSTLSSS